MITSKLLQRSFFMGLLCAAPLLVGAEGGGCSSDGDVPIGSHDAGNGVTCGANTCGSGEYCCNESCGICAEVGGACIQLVCGSDGGKGGEQCGKNVCGPGEYCCNASCGTCAKQGEGCTTIACIDPCEKQDAVGEGACDMMLGYAWDGNSCQSLSGCSCKGSDCGSLYQNPNDCAKAYAECGTSSGEPCGPVTCSAGQECCNESCGICTEPGGACIQLACEPECQAQDAKGQGLCAAFFGYAWDGSSCIGVGGCSCVGADCAALYNSPEACNQAHAKCP
jgi:hypothetical protein